MLRCFQSSIFDFPFSLFFSGHPSLANSHLFSPQLESSPPFSYGFPCAPSQPMQGPFMKRLPSQRASAPPVDLLALAEYVERFSSKTIVVLGDFVADAFQIGDITRVSREAPVLILKHRETQIVPGGGANAANNFVSLGAKLLPVTVVGDDAAGDALIQQFRQKGVNTSGILRAKGRAT